MKIESMNRFQSNLPYIKLIDILSIDSKEKTAHLSVSGSWPTPNWSRKNVDINYDENEMVVTIKIIGKCRSGIAMQMITPFVEFIRLKFQKKGIWNVEIIGKNRSKKVIIELN